MTLINAFTDLDRGHGARLLEATTSMGFSAEVAREGLAAEVEAWHTPGALEALRRELTDAPPGQKTPDTVLVIAAGTLPVSAMRATLMARLLDARVLFKPASGQEALGQIMADADDAICALPFSSKDLKALEQAIDAADTIVAMGSDSTIADLEARIPTHKRFVGYGHKVSAAWLKDVDEESLNGLAYDLCTWDQAGCLSPQVAWVGADPSEILPALAEAVRRVEMHLPMRVPKQAYPTRYVATTIADLTGRRVSTQTSELLSHPSSAFRPSPGWRTLWVLPLDPSGPRDMMPHLSTLAVAGIAPPCDLSHVRVCTPGQMQRPSLQWKHDGKPNLLPLLLP